MFRRYRLVSAELGRLLLGLGLATGRDRASLGNDALPDNLTRRFFHRVEQFPNLRAFTLLDTTDDALAIRLKGGLHSLTQTLDPADEVLKRIRFEFPLLGLQGGITGLDGTFRLEEAFVFGVLKVL